MSRNGMSMVKYMRAVEQCHSISGKPLEVLLQGWVYIDIISSTKYWFGNRTT